VEMTPAYGSKDQDKLFIVAEPFLDPIEHAGDDPLQVEGKARSLADQRIAEHLEELTPIKPKVSLSCKECTYRTNNLPWKMAKRRMRNHKRKTHHKDPNNNPSPARNFFIKILFYAKSRQENKV
jgi:hypothetical protein